jgi:FdhD protein
VLIAVDPHVARTWVERVRGGDRERVEDELTIEELVQKAALAGLAGIVAVGAPSSLAVELARECQMLLCAFVKHDSFNLYSGTLDM